MRASISEKVESHRSEGNQKQNRKEQWAYQKRERESLQRGEQRERSLLGVESEKWPGLATGYRLGESRLCRAQLWTRERRNLSFCSSKERADGEKGDKSNGAARAKRKKKRRGERRCEERV